MFISFSDPIRFHHNVCSCFPCCSIICSAQQHVRATHRRKEVFASPPSTSCKARKWNWHLVRYPYRHLRSGYPNKCKAVFVIMTRLIDGSSVDNEVPCMDENFRPVWSPSPQSTLYGWPTSSTTHLTGVWRATSTSLSHTWMSRDSSWHLMMKCCWISQSTVGECGSEGYHLIAFFGRNKICIASKFVSEATIRHLILEVPRNW